MNLQDTFGMPAGYGWPETEIDQSRMQIAFQGCFGQVNPVWWKLLAVCAQVRGGIADLFSKVVAAHHRAQNGIFSAEHCCRFCEITGFDPLTNGGAADYGTVDLN